MSYAPHHPHSGQPFQPVGFRRQRTNAMGVTGLIVSILALFLTCGLLSPLGLLFSMIGLLKRPRGEAIAGTVIGGIGTLAVVAVVGSFVYLGASAVNAARNAEHREATYTALDVATAEIEEFRYQNGSIPAGIEGNKIVLQHVDGWQTSLRYEPEGDQYRIRSAGADQQFETSDDILTGHAYEEELHDDHSSANS